MNPLRAVAAAAALAGIFAAAEPAAADGFRPLPLTARPIADFAIDGGATRFGELEFRGGLVLGSTDRDFGALSGLEIDGNSGAILAVADTGFWFSARLIETDGRLTGIADAKLAPILDAAGKPRRTKRASDAEGVRLTVEKGAKTALVVFEQSREVSRFAAEPDLAAAAARPMKLPESARTLNATRGFETIAIAPASSPLKGSIVLVAERALDKNGNHRGWILSGPRAGVFSIRRIGDFDITDGEFLPNGDLVILERLFSIVEGVGMRIRRIAAGDIAPGATADGPVVMSAGLDGHRIDNMEGIALRREADGSTTVFIVSDDNQSFLQQTLILKFAWRPAHTQ